MRKTSTVGKIHDTHSPYNSANNKYFMNVYLYIVVKKFVLDYENVQCHANNSLETTCTLPNPTELTIPETIL